MDKINFAGVDGEVIETSPHGSYVVVRLSDRITIVGTTNNQYNWQEMPDAASGFESFITYIGLRSATEATKYLAVVAKVGGYTIKKEAEPRKAKRVKAFPLEIKVRGLTPEFVAEVIRCKQK
ncbi:hypothetical protein QUB75_04660 [Microcoleus sp. K1-B6]|uniref:hypothetical protein n=1 Tax=unclassified Microcoleus TaxID=2642155 RepID=UPI002FD2C633